MNYTNDNGLFLFDELPVNTPYTVVPQLDENPLNGVTTIDLVILKKHILNIQPITSPYKLIAGDANNSGSISTLDLLAIRKLILQINPDFPENTSWRFVDAAYQFPNPQDPWNPAFPETYLNGNLLDDDMAANFIAVKIGDLNETAIANNLQAADDRTTGKMAIATEDLIVKNGELVSLVFTSQTLESFLGYQFTLNFDSEALEFVNLMPAEIGSIDNFGLHLTDEGAITTSWDYLTAGQDKDIFTQKPTTIFRAIFKGKKNAKISELLNLNSRFTKAEAYAENGDAREVELVFTTPDGGIITTNGFELYQNLPNPFRETTKIGFNLPEATQAILTIMDVSGKIITVITDNYTKGYHEIELTKNELNEKGVLYYRLETAEHTATKKMLIVR